MMNESVFFKSRRNTVWRQGSAVYKQILAHHDRPDPCAAAAFEADRLRQLSDAEVPVPRLISQEGDLIAMTYVAGLTLTDVIELAEHGETDISASRLARSVTDWFSSFYAVLPPSEIRGDVNCRNFLVMPDGRIAGVDFEERAYGPREADLGRIAAFILNYDPANTKFKSELVDALFFCFETQFHLDIKLVAQIQEQEDRDISVRRKKF